MKAKNIWRLFPVLIIVVIIVFFERKGSLEREKFYDTPINSHILIKKNNWSGGRSYDYITKSNIIITLLSNDSLKIGDSISKEAKTSKFTVYRKNQTENYEFYKNYDLKEDW